MISIDDGYCFIVFLIVTFPAINSNTGLLVFKEPRNSFLFVRRLTRSSIIGSLEIVLPAYKAVFVQDHDETCWLYFKCRESIEPLLNEIEKLAAPEFSPKSFRYPKFFQVVSGICVGLGIGLFFQAR